MIYFASAQEASDALELPLLLAVEASPSILERHGRLSRYAAPTPPAARLYHRLREAVLAAGGGFSPAAGGALWVAGPWGSLEHLPWAVGLADCLARDGARVGLAERDAQGPLAAIAAGGRRLSVRSAIAESLLGAPVSAIATDLEGVWILEPATSAAVGAPPSSPAAASWVVVTDTLPESLDGPYPAARGLTGTVLVAGYRDHSRRELETVVGNLRAAGHRLFGLVALGPIARPGRAPEAEPPAVEPVVVAARRTEPPAAEAVEGLPTASARPAPPTEEPPPEPTRGEGGPVPVPRHDEPTPPPETRPVEPPSPESRRAEAATPAERRRAEPFPAPPPQCDEDVTEPTSRPVEPAVPSAGPPSVPLLSTWDRQVAVDSRRRRWVAAALTAATTLSMLAVLYALFLRPAGVRIPGLPSGTPSESTIPGRSDWGAAEPGAPGRRVSDARAVETPPAQREVPFPLPSIPDSPPPEPAPPAAVDSLVRAARLLPGDDSAGARSTAAPGETGPTRAADEADGEKGAAVRGTASADLAAEGMRPEPHGEVVARDATSGAALDPSPSPGVAPEAGQFVIHLSSFKLEREADEEVARLQALGVLAHALRVEVPERGSWYRVVTGVFASFAEAESAALILQARGLVPYAHIAGDGGRGTPVPVGTLDRIRP